jgi:hypothetical protein
VRACAHVASALQTRVSLRWHVTRDFAKENASASARQPTRRGIAGQT